MATARTYAGDGKNAEVDWGILTNLDTNAEYISIIFIIIAIIAISVPGQLTASKVALFALGFPILAQGRISRSMRCRALLSSVGWKSSCCIFRCSDQGRCVLMARGRCDLVARGRCDLLAQGRCDLVAQGRCDLLAAR